MHDHDGRPIRVAEAVLDQDVFDCLQNALTGSASPIGRRSTTPRTPLLGVIKCGGCGKNLQLHTSRKRRKDGTYRVVEKIRCLSRIGSPACPGYVFLPDEEIVTPALRKLFEAVGDVPVTRRVYVRSTHAKGDPRNPSHDAGKDHWRFVPLGTTFAERWTSMGIAELGEDLLHAGITVGCHPRERGGHVLDVPEDFRERLAKSLR